ncbi:MAG TPA: endonuclease/exonuclease/phosphatase family protein [Gemmatimonadales bacterium]|nr:endonuclease/exonuclease/phosphatase family protein [Gemmatimonadales bacterium]
MLLVLGLAGCRTGRNYTTPEGPRFAGAPRVAPLPYRSETTTLRVVSFNIAFGVEVDSAIALLASEPALRGADILLLQEMDEAGTRRVADALGHWYVYYPSVFHLRTRRHFGNAVLSRWPIVDDKKIILPHLSRFARTQRIATGATILVGRTPVRVYSTHLATPMDISPAARRRQLRAILADAARYRHVVLGGDMNDHRVGYLARDMGYSWPTRRGPPTTRFGRWDHIFFKGLGSPASESSGTLRHAGGASDHLPVWAVALLAPEPLAHHQ